MSELPVFIACALVAGVSGWLWGFIYGERLGIKHTEKRWSDAVSRADAHRKYAASPLKE